PIGRCEKSTMRRDYRRHGRAQERRWSLPRIDPRGTGILFLYACVNCRIGEMRHVKLRPAPKTAAGLFRALNSSSPAALNRHVMAGHRGPHFGRPGWTLVLGIYVSDAWQYDVGGRHEHGQ